MDATTGSVPYASSNGNSAAARIPNRFLEAAEQLALTFLERRGDGSAICTACYRGSVAGVLTHGMTCAPGRMLELAAGQRTSEVSELVHVTDPAAALEYNPDWPPERKQAYADHVGEVSTPSAPEAAAAEVTCCHGRGIDCETCAARNENPCRKKMLSAAPDYVCVFMKGHSGVCVFQDSPYFHGAAPIAQAAAPQRVEKDLLGLAHKLLESLWHSREFALYIPRESTYGRSVHTWLTRYAEARLGRGFAVEMPGCAPAVLAVSESYSEPWSWGEEGGACFVLKSDGLEVALIAGDDSLSGDRILARRIAACVNACAGKSTEDLEAETRGAGSR